MKSKYRRRKRREAMRIKARRLAERDDDAVDALQQYEEALSRRTLWPRKEPEPMGEPWRPVMTEQQRKEHEQYVKDNDLPF